MDSVVSPRPAFKSGCNEKSEHAADDIVVMEVVLLPFSVLYFLNIGKDKEMVGLEWISHRFVDVVLNERDELTLAFCFSVL